MKVKLLVVIGLASLLFGAVNAQAYSHYTKLDQAASKIAGRQVEFHCLSMAESNIDLVISFYGAAAYVQFDPLTGKPLDYAVASYGACRPLVRHLQGEVVAPSRLAWSIIVLTHESFHLQGHTNEARTQCRAMRHFRYVAQWLGFSFREALYLEQEALRIDDAHNKKFPQYQWKPCKRPTR